MKNLILLVLFLTALFTSFSAAFAIDCPRAQAEDKSFVFSCDEICAERKAGGKNPCAGIYWFNNGQYHSTKNILGPKQCTYGVRTTPAENGSNCGCDWYPVGQKNCLATKRFAVDCNTFCYHEQLNPTGNNCFGVYWLKEDGHWRSTRSVRNGKMCQSDAFQGLRNFPRSEALTNCQQCAQFSSLLENPKNAEEISGLKKTAISGDYQNLLVERSSKIKEWIYCVNVDQCPKNSNNDPRCPIESMVPCHSVKREELNHHWANIKNIGCPHVDEETGKRYCSLSGDMTGEEAYGCLAGDPVSCAIIKMAQDRTGEFGAKGAWYRNAGHKFSRTNDSILFSRDMSQGLLAYVVKTKDKEALRLWLEFIANNKKVNMGLFFSLCPSKIGSGSDDRCRILPDTWGLIGTVAKYVGLTNKEIPKKIRFALQTATHSGLVYPIGQLSSRFVHVRSATAFESNLQILTGLILKEMGKLDGRFLGLFNYDNHRVFEILDHRQKGLNPWVHYLANKTATNYIAWLILELCPAEMPKFGERINITGTLDRLDYEIGATNIFTSTMGFQFLMGGSQYGYAGRSNGQDCATIIDYVLSGK